MPRARRQSRPQRLASAVAYCRVAMSKIEDVYSALETAMEELRGIQEEYEEWKDSLPENLQGSALGAKLDEVCGLDITDEPRSLSFDDLQTQIEEAEGVDLPLGFGRD